MPMDLENTCQDIGDKREFRIGTIVLDRTGGIFEEQHNDTNNKGRGEGVNTMGPGREVGCSGSLTECG